MVERARKTVLTTALEAHQRARECREAILREGMTVTGRDGQAKVHPLLAVERDGRSRSWLRTRSPKIRPSRCAVPLRRNETAGPAGLLSGQALEVAGEQPVRSIEKPVPPAIYGLFLPCRIIPRFCKKKYRFSKARPPPRVGFGGFEIFLPPPPPAWKVSRLAKGPLLVREILLGCRAGPKNGRCQSGRTPGVLRSPAGDHADRRLVRFQRG